MTPQTNNSNRNRTNTAATAVACLTLTALAFVPGCTQETQNQLGRAVQNWTGTHGVVDVVAGGEVYMRFLEVDKLSTAYGTSDSAPRPYRYGYGVVDENMNHIPDPGEKKVYFEVSDFSGYVFYDNYKR